jgi:Putative sensor
MTTIARTTTRSAPNPLARLARPFGARTWLRTLHLLADMPIGIIASTTALTVASLSVGLALTLVGVPLLVLTLVVARQYGRFERARVRALLGVALPAPASGAGGLAPRRWLRELRDLTGWKALLHALVALPLGVATSTVVLVGWVTAVALLAVPVSLPWLPDSSHIGPLQLATPLGALAAFVTGVVLTAAMPGIVRVLAAVDVAIARLLLAGDSSVR